MSAKMFHDYSYRRDDVLKHYYKRSKVESTFSMIKAKFGDAIRAKSDTGMINEVLARILRDNIACLIQSMCELGSEAKFWENAYQSKNWRSCPQLRLRFRRSAGLGVTFGMDMIRIDSSFIRSNSVCPDATMTFNLPKRPPRDAVDLIERGTGRLQRARAAILTPRYAATLIAERWWVGFSGFKWPQQQMRDRNWSWTAEAERAAESSFDRICYCLLTASDRQLDLQGAISIDLDANSVLFSGRKILYAKLLATAPKNRPGLVGPLAGYRHVGTNLMLLAMLESLNARLGGGVLLQPLPDLDGFYEKLNFVKVVDPNGSTAYYEIGGAEATALLRRKGWI